MLVVIPTLNREDRQITASYLPERWRNKTVFAVNSIGEGQKLADKYNIGFMKLSSSGIANVRQEIIEIYDDHLIFLMDDDLYFHHRENGKLVKSTPEDVGRGLDLMEEWLNSGIPFVGFSSRFGNNWIKGEFVENQRTCMAYGFDTSIIHRVGAKFNDVPVCEDYHIALSLLKNGYKNRMTALHTVTSPSVNKDGGCSVYRTQEMVTESMGRFVDMHKPYATLRKTKGDTQGFDIGYELRVSWQKAYNDAIARMNL